MHSNARSHSSDVFGSHFILLNRSFITDHKLAALWRGGRSAASALVVLLLRGWGRGSAGAFIRESDLVSFSGMRSRHAAHESLATLVQQHLITDVESPRKGVIKYCLGPYPVLNESGKGSARIAGAIVANGTWSSLSHGERFVALALCGMLHRYSFTADQWNYEAPPDVREILEARASMQAVPRTRLGDGDWDGVIEEGDEQELERLVRGLGSASLRQLSGFTGMDRSAVSRSLERLEARRLVHRFEMWGKTWMLLPEYPWGNGKPHNTRSPAG